MPASRPAIFPHWVYCRAVSLVVRGEGATTTGATPVAPVTGSRTPRVSQTQGPFCVSGVAGLFHCMSSSLGDILT